jgi:hypothetical protein
MRGTADKRRFHRVRLAGLIAKTGTIFVDVKTPPIACDIVDLSAGGACIEVHGTEVIPRKFVLHHSGVKKSCNIVWQKGRRVGVTY